MRATCFYTMLAMLIMNVADSTGEVQSELKPVVGAPSINAVKLESTRLVTSVHHSALIESDVSFRRVTAGNSQLVEVIAVSSREVVVNAKAAGETTLIVWSAEGKKAFNVVVLPQPCNTVTLGLKLPQSPVG